VEDRGNAARKPAFRCLVENRRPGPLSHVRVITAIFRRRRV